ncbi:aspartyl/asparaginyl beta-hydroxylase domain-containing protein [Chitiniphilus purpureus]|uniref:Aspartyl/asparaginyl beta-hydroxylase domain-containing protein n=1 Tax=Chitiniphilus purpureus TaxID=2981137 RepID=A0ABY6DKX9_9NEIS|nr:aspartyl/asparaginyl beta-hydroxylase domain-containing protein [Chitiniphilus sp. CD1]UXY15022.1 aspartyl/asparaginyl beta-hydroxylase domain-containing protein [Chitiniphilus sp. CD1]
MSLPAYARLPVSFDVALLQGLLDQLPDEAWSAHFNTGDYQGEWRGVALIAPPAAVTPLAPPQRDEAVAATGWLLRFPAWQAVLARIEAPLRSARLLLLAPGSRILEHQDPDLGQPDGDVRLHIPLRTDPAVEFLLDGEAVPMAPGECWMLDLSRPHAVNNDSAISRVHLVLDVARNEWLMDAIAQGLADTPSARPGRGAAAFEQLRTLIHADPALVMRLGALVAPEAFTTELLRLALEHGLVLDAHDVARARRRGKQAWLQQWRA